MREMIKHLSAAFLTIACGFTSVQAQEIGYPINSHLYIKGSGSEYGDSSSLVVDCEPSEYDNSAQMASEIRCTFAQVFIKHVLNPDELEATTLRQIDWIDTEIPKMSESELLDLKGQICFDDIQKRASKEDFERQFHSAKGEIGETLVRLTKQACTTETHDDFIRVMRDIATVGNRWEVKRCRLWKNAWSETFSIQKSDLSQYWYANPKPSGTCQVVKLSTLKRSDDGLFWHYDSKTLVLSPDAESPLSCKSLQKEPIQYGPESKSVFMDCREIVH